MKVNPLLTMKNIGLSGLQIKQSKIPINPLKLVRVCQLSLILCLTNSTCSSLKGTKCKCDVYTPLTQKSPLRKLMKKREELEEEPPEKEELDWWSKYYASLEEIERKVSLTLLVVVKNV